MTNRTLLKADAFMYYVDTNHDGKLTREEWLNAGLNWHPYDGTNCAFGDKGYLTKDDLERAPWHKEIDPLNMGILTVEYVKLYDRKHGGPTHNGTDSDSPAPDPNQ
jgi:hypothetical protein